MTPFYQYGARVAADTYGVAKHANWGKTILRGMRNLAIGEAGIHGKVMQQARQGKLWSQGGLWREGLLPSSGFPRYMTIGLNGLALYDALRAPPEQRGTSLGGLAGSVAGSAMGYPYGMVGSIAASMLGGAAGGALGSVFDKKKPPENSDAL